MAGVTPFSIGDQPQSCLHMAHGQRTFALARADRPCGEVDARMPPRSPLASHHIGRRLDADICNKKTNTFARRDQPVFANQSCDLVILQHQPRAPPPVDATHHAPSRADLHELPPADAQRAQCTPAVLLARINRLHHFAAHADTDTWATDASSASIHRSKPGFSRRYSINMQACRTVDLTRNGAADIPRAARHLLDPCPAGARRQRQRNARARPDPHSCVFYDPPPTS